MSGTVRLVRLVRLGRPARLALAPAAVLAVVAAALSVGGTGSDEPSTTGDGAGGVPTPRVVSARELCDGFGALAAAQQAHFSAPSPATVAALRDAARRWGDLAAGTTMPDPARRGVAYVVTALTSLEDDATPQDVVDLDAHATLADDSHGEALAAYLADC